MEHKCKKTDIKTIEKCELNRENIIKALEHFHHRILNTKLAEKVTEDEMMGVINAIALIKELTEENERLVTALANYDRQTEVRIAEEYYTAEAFDELREENERLKKTLEENTDSCLEFYKSVNEQIEVSKKAIVEETTNRTFARFARYFGTYTDNDMVKIRDIFELLDKFAKEMLDNG